MGQLRRWQLSCRLPPCRISPQICVAVTRPPVCVSPVVSVIPTRVRPLCVFLTGLCFLFVFVLLRFVKSFLPFLAVLFALSFALVLAFALTRFYLCPCPCLVCLCPCRACLWFCRPCQTIHSLGCFAGIQFSFDNLWPCGRKFHIMNSFLGTFDPDCPIADKSIGTSCVFLRANSTFSIFSQISSILSCQQC